MQSGIEVQAVLYTFWPRTWKTSKAYIQSNTDKTNFVIDDA